MFAETPYCLAASPMSIRSSMAVHVVKYLPSDNMMRLAVPTVMTVNNRMPPPAGN